MKRNRSGDPSCFWHVSDGMSIVVTTYFEMAKVAKMGKGAPDPASYCLLMVRTALQVEFAPVDMACL